MALDLAALLAPVEGDDPAGPDLSYDAERTRIDQAFDRSISIDSTTGASGNADIDWRPVIAAIETQSAKTKDVWLAVYLTRAGARAGQLATVEMGAEYLAGLLEQQWDTVHPKLADYGFQGRKGPCEALTSFAEFIGPLRRTPLLEHPRIGRFTGADFERFQARGEAEDNYVAFQGLLKETPDETLAGVAESLERIAAALRRADAVLTAKAEGDTASNFQATYEALAKLIAAVRSFTAAPPAEEASAGVSGESAGPGSPAAGAPARISNRQDVIRAIDAIVDYYRRDEPASPVPLTLLRVREWVTLDFLKLLEDIAPGSLDEARRVLVSQRKKDGG
jgi:type VI secretion system ImpA family protein